MSVQEVVESGAMESLTCLQCTCVNAPGCGNCKALELCVQSHSSVPMAGVTWEMWGRARMAGVLRGRDTGPPGEMGRCSTTVSCSPKEQLSYT